MIKIDNYLNKLDENLLIFGLQDILKSMHKKYRDIIMLNLKDKINKSTYYYWMSGKSPIPLKFINMLSKIDNKILEEAYERMIYVSAGNKKSLLPKYIDENLAYIIGAMHGDGHMHKNKRYITLTVDSQDYIKEALIPFFQKVFDVSGSIINFRTYYRLEIGSKATYSFLLMFCPRGKKIGLLKVPKEIKSDRKLLTSYLSGLFDTDGCIGYDKNRNVYFVFVQRDKNFVFDIYKCLISLGLNINKPRVFYTVKGPGFKNRDLEEWRIYIGSKKTLYNFLDKISFLHPIKKNKSDIIKNKIISGPGEN